LKGEVIHSAICFLGSNQHNLSVSSGNFLDLVFSNFAGASLDHVQYGLVHSDPFHPPFNIECSLPHRGNHQNSNFAFMRFPAGD
jgi:hypothetical protein